MKRRIINETRLKTPMMRTAVFSSKQQTRSRHLILLTLWKTNSFIFNVSISNLYMDLHQESTYIRVICSEKFITLSIYKWEMFNHHMVPWNHGSIIKWFNLTKFVWPWVTCRQRKKINGSGCWRKVLLGFSNWGALLEPLKLLPEEDHLRGTNRLVVDQ